MTPLHTSADHARSESMVEKARKARAAPERAVRKQLQAATRNSRMDEARAQREAALAAMREAEESKMASSLGDFEEAGPNLMQRARSKAKARKKLKGKAPGASASMVPLKKPKIAPLRKIKSECHTLRGGHAHASQPRSHTGANPAADALRAAQAHMS